MSMMATGRPTLSRPGARGRSGTLSTLGQRFWAGSLHGLASARQAGIRHEILVRVEGLLARAGDDPLARARGQYPPALLVVEEVRDHDLVEHLLVHRGVEDRQQHLDAAVEIP